MRVCFSLSISGVAWDLLTTYLSVSYFDYSIEDTNWGTCAVVTKQYHIISGLLKIGTDNRNPPYMLPQSDMYMIGIVFFFSPRSFLLLLLSFLFSVFLLCRSVLFGLLLRLHA